jgi:hypothetical protein
VKSKAKAKCYEPQSTAVEPIILHASFMCDWPCAFRHTDDIVSSVRQVGY